MGSFAGGAGGGRSMKKLMDQFCSVLSKACRGSSENVRRGGRTFSGGHHRGAISDGLRKGSSKAGRVMAQWRWRKR